MEIIFNIVFGRLRSLFASLQLYSSIHFNCITDDYQLDQGLSESHQYVHVMS